MKLRVRTLTNTEGEIDVDGEEFWIDVKRKVEKIFPQMIADKQILIHQGKFLSDALKVSQSPLVKEGDRLVVMLSKAPTLKQQQPQPETPAQNPPTATAAQTPDPSTAPVAGAPSTETSSAAAASSSATAQAPSAPVSSTSPSATTPERPTPEAQPEAQVDQLRGTPELIATLTAMGFSAADAADALSAAFNDPNRAVEYLTHGFPPGFVRGGSAMGAVGGAPATAEAGRPPSPEESNVFAALRQHPMFDQLRHAIRADPGRLPAIMQMINSQNPELAQLILDHQMEFLHLIAGGGGADQETDDQMGAESGSGDSAGGPRGLPSPAVTIQISAEQRQKLDEMKGLGFSEPVALQALVACEWDSERAANLLFDHAADFED